MITAWTNNMSFKKSRGEVNKQEKYQVLRAMEQYHWTSVKSFWIDDSEVHQKMEKIIEQKQKLNQMLNDLQVSMMQNSQNKYKTRDLTFLISDFNDKK